MTPYQDFHDPASVLNYHLDILHVETVAPLGSSVFEELRFKFQLLYHLTAYKNYESALYKNSLYFWKLF